jgi:spore germination protein KC
MIAKGKARDYLKGDSMIENTVGSQVLKQLKFSADLAGRSVEASLLDIAFQLKSESASAMLPIIARDRKSQKNVVHGVALAHPDKVVGRVVPDRVPFLMILAGKYKYGFVEIPCGGQSSGGQKETIEILKSHSRVTPVLEGDSVSARIDVHIEASVGELVCTTVRDMDDEQVYEQKVEQYLKKQMESVLGTLQKHKADVLGIGHKIYLRHPSRWRKWKPDWPERFARIPIEVTVDVHIQNSKMMSFSPFSRSGEE